MQTYYGKNVSWSDIAGRSMTPRERRWFIYRTNDEREKELEEYEKLKRKFKLRR